MAPRVLVTPRKKEVARLCQLQPHDSRSMEHSETLPSALFNLKALEKPSSRGRKRSAQNWLPRCWGGGKKRFPGRKNQEPDFMGSGHHPGTAEPPAFPATSREKARKPRGRSSESHRQTLPQPQGTQRPPRKDVFLLTPHQAVCQRTPLQSGFQQLGTNIKSL